MCTRIYLKIGIYVLNELNIMAIFSIYCVCSIEIWFFSIIVEVVEKKDHIMNTECSI